MRNRSVLALLEQALMVLVFAAAAALCLRIFVWADVRSADNAVRDRAVLAAERAAETLKSCRGDTAAAAELLGGVRDGETWRLPLPDGGGTVEVRLCPPRLAFLGEAAVTAFAPDGRELIRLSVSWQEVSADG